MADNMRESTYIDLETLFLALGDKTRLRLLALLAGGEQPVGDLVDQTGESQPKVSRHLAYLRNADVVVDRRDGKFIYYSIQQQDDPMLKRILGIVVRSIAPEWDLAKPDDNLESESSADPVEHRFVEEVIEEEVHSVVEIETADTDEIEVYLL